MGAGWAERVAVESLVKRLVFLVCFLGQFFAFFAVGREGGGSGWRV